MNSGKKHPDLSCFQILNNQLQGLLPAKVAHIQLIDGLYVL